MMAASLERQMMAERSKATRTFPNNCSPHVPHDYPRRSRRGPKLFSNCRTIAPKSSTSCSGNLASAKFQHWPKLVNLCSMLAKFAQHVDTFDKRWSIWATYWSKLAKLGEQRPIWVKFVKRWSILATIGQQLGYINRVCANLCEISTTVGHLLRNCSATLGQLRSWYGSRGE